MRTAFRPRVLPEMRDDAHIVTIIPALNEARSIGKVIDAIPAWVDEVIVADNGSTDDTVEIARAGGATVVHAARRGYGSACLAGIAAIARADIVVFLDGDFSDHPEQMDTLVDPILRGRADMVIGSRVRGHHERGALTPQARFGNALACFLIRRFWGIRYSDLGPFRAIRYATLQSLDMRDPDYGWTVEMQIKAALNGVPSTEVPVDYRKRIGVSKVSGTVRGVAGAGYKILSTIFISAARHYFVPGGSRLREQLSIFTRYPVPGETKTRLIPALGADGAAALQRAMTEHMLDSARDLAGTQLEIRYTGSTADDMRAWLGTDLDYAEQGGGDLGDRMMRTFRDAFESGADRSVIVGVDCPDITMGIVSAAFGALARADVVLGPATDGGYYLIGLRRGAAARALPAILEDIDWGTDSVYAQTRACIRSRKLRLATLAPLDDVDRPEDVAAWERAQGSAADDAPRLSVIIPALNEGPRIRDTIGPLADAESVEILLVDGGSGDDTVAAARELGATIVETRRGRAHQMNLGAARARGDTLLFLHADTRLPAGFEHEVRALLAEPGVAAGAFRFATDDRGLAMRFIAWWANWRSRRFSMPYGDQAMFVRKHLFREIGGFPDLPIMEDYVMARRLSKRGRIAILPCAAVTSSRRWRTLGPWRTTLYNQVVVLLFWLRVPAKRIERLYNRARGLG